MKNNGMSGWTGTITVVPSLSPPYTFAQNFISTDGSSNGFLMKLPSDPTVYEIHNGTKEPLSLDVFNQRGYSFNNVVDVPQTILNMFQTQAANLPDLTIRADVAFSYTAGQSGVQIPVTVTRTGGVLSSGSSVPASLYWSTDPQLGPGDLVLWSSSSSDFPVSDLNNIGSRRATATVNIPAVQTDGTYFIIAVVDPDDAYAETDENNNGVGVAVSIQSLQGQAEGLSLGTDDGNFGSGDSPESNAGFNDDSVNTAVGNFNYTDTDLIVRGRGLDFNFSRSYNSKDSRVGPMGTGWSHSFNIFLVDLGTTSNDSVTVHHSDGKLITFDRENGTDVYRARIPAVKDFVTRNSDGTWSLRKTDQREYRFNNLGKLQYIQDRNGNLMSLSYNSDFTLRQVIDTVGRVFNFFYTNSLLTAVTDPAGRQLQYQYAGTRLAQYRDANSSFSNYVYDSNDRLSQVYDGRGTRIMTNTYDPQGRLLTQINGRGFLWTFSYDDDNHITYVSDPNQKIAVYRHDARYNLQRSTDRLNNSAAIEYDPFSNRSRVSDFANSYFSYVYDGNGNVQQSRDPLNNIRQFVYDGLNNPTKAIDELSHSTSMNYDPRGNLSTITDANSNVSSVNYDGLGQPTAVTDFNHNTTFLNYDSQGNLIRIEDAMHNVTSFGYDGIGRRISMTNARGKTTRYFYDSNDNLTTVQRPIGATVYTYDQADNLIALRDPAGNLTTYEYDANKNLTKEIDPTRNYYLQHTYDTLDRRDTTRDKRGNVMRFEYDNEGRLLSEIDANNNKTSYTYDANGNRLTVTDANNQTTHFEYDALNRLRSTRDPLNNTIVNEYDAAGRLIRETDGRGNVTQYTYDEVNNLTQINDPEGGVTNYVYDANHYLGIQVDANRHASTFNRDQLNRITSSVDPLNNMYRYTYDEVGNRLTQTDAKGQRISFTYDDNDRLSSILYPNSASMQFAYDANGNLTQMTDSLGTTRYSYDSLNRMTSYTDVYGKNIGYQYDPNGNIQVLIYPDGKQVRYDYDAGNRMTAVTDWSGRTLRYEYNSINLLTKIVPPDVTDNGPTTYAYDLAGRLTGMVNYHTHSGPNSYAFTLDQNGNRITASVQEPLPNRVATSSQNARYDEANRIRNAGSTSFGFDANGNMTSKTENGTTTTYTYDFNDRLTNDQTNSYFYNGQGVRVAKSRGSSVTRYVTDINRELSQVLCETDGSGNITNYYIYGQGLIYQVLPNTNSFHHYYQFDPNGSTISMTSDGDFFLNRYAYDPFGKLTNSAEVFPNTDETFPNQFKFGGRFGLMDEGNGLIYVRARYYSPELGRFLTKDPLAGDLRNGQNLNRYVYALDNPVRLIDADGLSPLDWKSLVQTGLNIGAKQFAKWGANHADLSYKFNDNVEIGLDVRALSGFALLVHGALTAKTILYDNVKTELGISNFSDFVRSTKSAFKNASANIRSASTEDWARTLTSVSAIALNGVEDLTPYVGPAAQYCTQCRYRGEILYAVEQRVINSAVNALDRTPQFKAPPHHEQVRRGGNITPRGPVVKVMPRGPAATPIMPRGPKPAPIMPRGPAKKK